MKVVVPFAGPSWPIHAVKLALRQDGVDAALHHMTRENDYYDLLARLWSEGEGFIVVEHDIVVWPGGLQELANCDEPWCTLPYYCSVGWIEDGLGCTKFSHQMIQKSPHFLKEPFPACCAHTRHYCGLDRLIAHRAETLGLKPHVHQPGVSNLNEKWT